MTLVLRSDQGAVVTLTLNRPDKLNALTSTMFGELRAHLDAIAADDAVGCVVLKGAGRSFCAGRDLDDVRSAEVELPLHYEAETIDRLETLPAPTIVQVHGHCYTGALELALGGDLVVAATDARFADTHAKFGLSPIWGMSVRLPERVGRARARDMMFTSEPIDGAAALAAGLADRTAPADELDDTVSALAAKIAGHSVSANRINKRLLLAGEPVGRRTALLLERSRPFGLAADRAARLSGSTPSSSDSSGSRSSGSGSSG